MQDPSWPQLSPFRRSWSPNMPPIPASHEGYGSPSWTSAPYSTTKPRQRTTSLRDELTSSTTKRQHGDVSHLPDYLAPSVKGLRRGSTNSSDESSSSSWSSSQRSTIPRLSESPAPMTLPSISNPTGRSAPEFAYESASHHPRASTRSRRPTLHGDNMSRRSTSGLEAENLGWRAPDVLGALPLEQSLARELEREPPLTLPKPWSYEDTSNHHFLFLWREDVVYEHLLEARREGHRFRRTLR